MYMAMPVGNAELLLHLCNDFLHMLDTGALLTLRKHAAFASDQ